MNPKSEATPRLSWILAGVGFAFLLFLLFFKKLYCFYTYDPSAAFLLGALTALGAISGAVIRLFGEPALNIKKGLPALSAFLLTLALLIFLSPFFMDIELNACVEGFDEMVALIRMEENAVEIEYFVSIVNIYTNDAMVYNAKTDELLSYDDYYFQKFASERHCEVDHFSFEVAEYPSHADEVVLRTGSQGKWGWEGGECEFTYHNEAGADRWTFVKTKDGWKIKYFSFNNSE